jgi:hypothetical protein
MNCRKIANGFYTVDQFSFIPCLGSYLRLRMGVFTYGLRLPEQEIHKAINAGASRVHKYKDGSTFDLGEIGEEWIFGSMIVDEVRMCLVAFEYAGAYGREHRYRDAS